MNDLIGQNLGRYHIIEPLGQGGMASVFKAYDTTLERNVAVKIIRPDIEGSDGGEFLKRFQREAKSLAQLDHPFILKVLDYGEQDGIPYLVMPFVPGGTLKQKLMGNPMPYQEAAALLAPIAQALDYAHQQKIIHRDVKPANILISQSGAPLLSDFGIAKMLTSTGSTQLTAAGVGIGTPDYMAPEQWAGEADARTDVYSLGVVFYEMVTGHRPFTADTPAAVLVKHLRDPLPRPKSFVHNLPDEAEQVLFKALDKEPEHRYQTMGEFASALEKLARSEATVVSVSTSGLETVKSSAPLKTEVQPAKPVPAAPPAKKSGAGKIGLIAVAAIIVIGVLCLLVGGGAWAAFSRLKANRVTEVPATVTTQATSLPEEPPTATAKPQEKATPELPFEITELPTTGAPIESIEGFPVDVPLLTDNNGDLMTTVSQGTNMYSFTTNMAFDDVTAFFTTEMEANGWELTTEQSQNGQKMWYYMKGEARMVMIGLTQEDAVTRVIIMLVNQ